MRALWVLLAALLAAATLSGARESVAPRDDRDDLAGAISSFSDALASNDAAGVERWLDEDWRIIEGGGAVIGRARFLAAVRSGALRHDAMHFDEEELRPYGDTATWTSRARGSGRYAGAPFTFDERSTDVWVHRRGRWLCVLTQLTRIMPAPPLPAGA